MLHMLLNKEVSYRESIIHWGFAPTFLTGPVHYSLCHRNSFERKAKHSLDKIATQCKSTSHTCFQHANLAVLFLKQSTVLHINEEADWASHRGFRLAPCLMQQWKAFRYDCVKAKIRTYRRWNRSCILCSTFCVQQTKEESLFKTVGELSFWAHLSQICSSSSAEKAKHRWLIPTVCRERQWQNTSK